MRFLGIDWVGVNPQNGQKLLLSLIFTVVVMLASRGLRGLVGLVLRRTDHATVQTKFWTRQGISLLGAVVLVLGLLSIWFDNPARLATALGLVTAGLAFALQQPVAAVAGYFVIMRGETFNVGDRISMGGVRGDVIRLGFIQTTIMEMGQPPAVQAADPAMWVKSRQFTGRIVTVSNARIFSEPVYNYTRDFPYIWEEMAVPVTYTADRAQAEAILLAAAREHAVQPDALEAAARRNLEERYDVQPLDLTPRVYWRITDNWLELTVRFLVHDHQIRGAKDAMSRRILEGFDAAGIGIASATYDIVGLPPIVLKPSSTMQPEATS